MIPKGVDMYSDPLYRVTILVVGYFIVNMILLPETTPKQNGYSVYVLCMCKVLKIINSF